MSGPMESGRMRRLFDSNLKSVKNYFGRDQWFYAWDVEGHTQYIRWFAARAMKGGAGLEAGADAVVRGWRSTWWEWTDGSRPFHWRWPLWYWDRIRDGLEVFFQSSPPRWKRKQTDIPNQEVKGMVLKKLTKVRERCYMAPGFVLSLTVAFFAVPKGEDDIRMVYDSTVSGLNEAMWVPRFGMSSLDTHYRG